MTEAEIKRRKERIAKNNESKGSSTISRTSDLSNDEVKRRQEHMMEKQGYTKETLSEMYPSAKRTTTSSQTKQPTQKRESLDIDAREWASIRAEAQKSNALKTTDKIARDYARNNPPRSATTSSEDAKEAFKGKTVDMQKDAQSAAEQKRLENMSESERADYVRKNAQKPSGTKASKITLENKKKPQVEQMVGEEVETEMQKPAKSEQAYKNEYEKSEKQYQDYIEANGGRGKMILDTLGDVAKDEYEVDEKIIELDRNRKEAEANYEYAQEYARYVEQKRYKDMYDSLDESDYALLDDIINSQEASDNANLSFVLQSVRDQEGTTRDDTTMYTEASTKAYEALKAKGYTEDEITKLMRYRLSLRNAEISKQHTGESKQFAKEHPLLASGVSVMTNLASPVAIVEPIRAYMTDTPVDPNASWFGASQMTSDIRQTVQDENDLYVELDGKQVDIHDEIYNATMSTADSLLAGTIMPGLGLKSKSTSGIVRAMVRTADSMLGGSLVGGQAMASAMQDVARRGGTPEEVIKTGLFHFFSETVSEAVSLGNFKALQSSGKKGLVNLGVDLLKNAGVNASEEMVTEAANIVYDKYALGDISNFELNVQAYMQTQKPDGTYYTREEAEKLAWKDAQKQIREAGQSGFVQGLISGAPATVSGRFKQNVSNASLGQQLKQSGQAEAIVKEARQSDDKAVQEWVQRINKTDKTTSQLNVKDSDLGGVAVAMADKNEDGSPNLARYFPETEKSSELTAEEKAEISKPTLEKEGGKVISVASVENVSDGKVEVKDSKGETRELDVNKLDGVAKELWSYASQHFTEAKTVESFIDSYDGENVETYSRVYKGVFDLASTGMTANRIKEEGFYDLDALNNTAFESAVKAGHTAMSLKAGMVDLTTVRKSKSQELIMKIADSFGQKHGMNIVFVDTLGNREGFLNRGTNQIVIALDASDGAISRTLGHEAFHYVKVMSSEQAKQITDFVVNTMTRLKGAEWVESRYEFYAKQGYNTKEAQIEEFVADQMFEVFSSDRAVKEFVAEDMNLAQKVIFHIKDAIEEIKSILKKLVATGKYEDIVAWEEDLDALQKLNDMMLDALRNIEQRNQMTVQEQEIADAFGNELGEVKVNEEGETTLITNKDESVIAYSHVTWNNGGKGELEKALKRNGYNASEVADIIESVEDIADFLEELSKNYADNHGYTLLGEHLATDVTMDVKNGKMVLHSIVNNGDYPVNIDLALNCKKRVAYMRVMRDLINNGVFESVKYDGDAIAKVNEILRNNGFETACLGCFVESRRLQFQAWAETIVQEWNNAVDKYDKNAKYFGYAKVKKGASAMTEEQILQIDRELSSVEKNEQGNAKLGGGAVSTKMKRLLKTSPTLRQKITVADLLTPEGLTNLRRENPNLFSLVKSRYGAASPKIVQDYNPYSGEMANLTFARVKDITHNAIKGSADYIAEAEKALEKEKPIQPKKMNVTEFKKTQEYIEWDEKVQTLAMRNYLYDIGGARMQSFSDFMIENVFDYVQIVADLAANKFPMHTYTKEIVMMRLFGMSGMKMNGSLICHVDKTFDKKYAGLLPASEANNGNALLVHTEEGDFAIGFDDYARYNASKGTNDESYIQSIGFKDVVALQLDKRYSPYVGNITIGVSDLHIKAMLDSPLFRMVIPYHASGMLPQFAKLVGVDKYNDYTDYQNTTVKQCYDINGNEVSRFKKGNKLLAIDTSYPFNAELKKVGDPKVAAQNYIDWCAEKHPVYDGKVLVGYATFSPKFSDSPYGTDFSKHENYYKLLEDFNVYDSVTETYAEQGAVNMVFPSADNRLTEEEKAEYRKALEESGVFSADEINKYVAKADMTFEEIIKAELDNRSLYESSQSKKYDATIKEIADTLVRDHSRSGQIASYKEFAKILKEGTSKQKDEQKGKFPLKGTYDVPSDIHYSTKREYSVSEDASDYILDSKEYQEIIDIVDQRYNLTNKKMLSPKAIDRLAGRLLSKASSKYDREQLTTRLTALFDYMANSNELDWEDVMRSAAEISYDILKNSSSIDRSMQNQYRDTLDYLKGLTVYISPEVKAEIKSRYGSLDNYRRVLGNRVKLTTTDSSKVSLDSLWKELNEYHPEMFGEEVGYLDQPEELATFFDIVKPKPVNQYELEWDIDEASYDFALQIYDEYFNIPEVQSQSRRHQLEMERLKGKYNAQIADIRRGYKERMKAIRDDRDAKINALRKENREAYEKLRATKNAKIEETKELYRQRNKDYRDKRNEMDNRRKLRRQVLNTTKKLTDLLVNPSDKKHIPQELIVGISSFAKAMTDHGAFSTQRAANLQRAFRNISENATDPDFNIASMYDDEIATMLEDLVTKLSDKRIGEMTSSELRAVNEIAQYFSHIVTMSNRAFSESIRERLSDLQTEAYDEISAQSKDKKRMVSKLNMGLLKPVTFFEVVESKTLEKLYTNIRNGEQKWAKIVSEAKQKNRSAQKEYGYKAWADDKVEITTERGDKLSLTVKEALSIYATSRRKKGVDHIMVGGIVLEEDARKQLEKKNKLRKNKDASVNVRSMNVPLTMGDIQTINSKLTKNQKAYADEMVAYMSNDMANLGNEVSMRLYGIRKYNEAHYFPLKSAINFLYTEPGVESDTRIKHMSMTKQTDPKANNPVMIDDFSKTVMSHCQDMALYSSFVLPLEDFKRVWNYQTPSIDQKTPSGIKQQLDMIYGSNANRYIEQLLTDINGGVTKQAGADYVNKMIGLAKKNSVFASLSVAVQQPSALARSMAYIDPKYFVGIQKKGTWEEIKKYAPVAIVKEMGYFDTGIGRQAVEWMNETDYEGLKEKAFAFFRDSDYRDDKLSFLPAFMDEITWGRIWVAVKNETKAKYPELDGKSEEFLEKCGERFTYVIDRTQVYDSVFSRSEWMRSKDTGVKVATAFMSEPLTSYNMLYNAAVKLRHGDVKFATKTVAAYIASVVLNSVLKSFVLAARDDDEEKSYWEKYLANLVSGITGEPFDMIPYFKDLISLIQGYDSSRMDTQAIADIAQASQTLLNANKTPWEKVRSVLNATGMVMGLPIKNIIRDTEMIVKGAEKILSGEYESTTNEGIKNAILGSYDSTKYSILDVPKLAEQVIEAQINGDTEHYNKQKKNMLEKYNGDTKEVKKQLNRTLGEMYKEGKIDRTQATRFMRNTLTMKQKDIDKKFKSWEEQKKAKEDE